MFALCKTHVFYPLLQSIVRAYQLDDVGLVLLDVHLVLLGVRLALKKTLSERVCKLLSLPLSGVELPTSPLVRAQVMIKAE